MTAEERPLLRRANIAIVLNRLIESKANSLSEDKIAGIKMALEEMSKMLGVHDLEIMLETRIDPYGE